MRAHNVEIAGRAPRHFAGDKFKQQNAQRINIRARVLFVALHLFGTHVFERADEFAGLRQFAAARHARDAEIGDFDFALAASASGSTV